MIPVLSGPRVVFAEARSTSSRANPSPRVNDPGDRLSEGGALSSAETLLTTRDLAQRWQVHVGSLANDRSAGRGVPYVKIGGVVRYRLSDVEVFEASCRISTQDAS